MRNTGAAAKLKAPVLPDGQEESAFGTEAREHPIQLVPCERPEEVQSAAAKRSISGVWLAPELLPTETSQYRWTKRIFDIGLSLLLLPFVGLLILLIALVVGVTSGFPVFYRQERLGQHGTTFQILKFRTMSKKSNQLLAEWLASHPHAQREWQRTHKLKNDPRITRLGRFLRETSLDELPQIINVLRGEMSLVGPRPIVQAERIRYREHFPFYSAALPGITGLWQVSGRCNVTYDERVLMDVNYVCDWSLMGDVAILMRTPRSVFCRDGAY